VKTLPPSGLLLLSGGMDSTTLLWWMKARGVDPIHTVAFDYGQRHRVELDCSRDLSRAAGAVTHMVFPLDLTPFSRSPLTDPSTPVPDASERRQVDTVVPYRNALFLTAAAAHAESLGVADLFISPVLDDHAAYRDCRREFYDAMEAALSLGATREGVVRIHTPFVGLSKADVVRTGLDLGVPYGRTHSCYRGCRPACGTCDACSERVAAFRAVGRADPVPYAIPVGWV
jgi:7-cyano-7-deazaguanine synthase